MDFKLRLLKEYYESGSSMYGVSKKYGVDDVTFLRWVRSFESQSLSLPDDLSELENQVYMARKKSIERKPSAEMTELEGCGMRTSAFARPCHTPSFATRLSARFWKSVASDMA